MSVGRAMDALKRQYPRPEPNPDWVSHCVDGLVADGKPDSNENVLEEYLDSDLAQSTLRGVIPQADEEGKLPGFLVFPSPTLLQVVSITDIGASAFSLQTTLEQRREVFSGATRIRGIDDDDEDEIDESKLPAYPRSILSLVLSDGRNTVRAIEYRRLEGLELGETRLGIKLLLHRVKVLRNILLLEPSNCTIVGGWIEALEHGQPQAFVDGLKERLDAAKNAPARGSRGRTVKLRGSTSTRARSTRGTSTAARGAAASRGTARPPVSDAARAARAAAILAAAGDQAPPAPARPTPPSRSASNSAPPAGQTSGSYANPTVISDDEEDFDDFDDSFLAAVDEVEPVAAASASSAPKRSQRSSGQTTVQRSSGRTTIPEDAEIIEISD